MTPALHWSRQRSPLPAWPECARSRPIEDAPRIPATSPRSGAAVGTHARGRHWMPRIAAALLALALPCSLAATALGHAAHGERLARSSEQLASRPSDVHLLLERADLYRRAGMRAEAEADL